MKKTIIIISLLIGIASSAIAAKDSADKPVQVEFATKIISVFAGQDKALSEVELTRVLSFLQENLPEQVSPSGMTTRLSREYNASSAARGDMTDERLALREYPVETVVVQVLEKYDANEDSYLTRNELSPALAKIIGVPNSDARITKGNVAQR